MNLTPTWLKKLSVIQLFCFLLILFFNIEPLFSQTIDYKTENKTHDLSPLKISISFLNIEQILTPITAGILVEGQLKDKLFYNAQFRQAYIRNFTISKDKLLTTQKESNGTVFEAGADLVFRNKTKKGKLRVVTSSNGTSESFFMADAEVRKYWALSGGVFEYTRPKYVNSDSSEYIISNNQDLKAPKDHFLHFNQNTFGIYAGLVHRKIKKAAIVSDGTRYRKFYSTKFYMHVMIGATKVGDIIYTNNNYKVDNAKQMPIGYRLGWQWDQMGVVTGFEFGKMPGVRLDTPVEKSEIDKIFKSNPYLNYVRLTFHFNVFGGDKNYHLKSAK